MLLGPPPPVTWALEGLRGVCAVLCSGAMETGAEVRERAARERGSPADALTTTASGNGGRGLALSGQSYWLDVWLMLLIDLVLFVFVYLLP